MRCCNAIALQESGAREPLSSTAVHTHIRSRETTYVAWSFPPAASNLTSVFASALQTAPSQEREPHAHPSGSTRTHAVGLPRSVLIAQTLLLALLFAIPPVRALYHQCVIDPDVWWHLSIGDFVAQHHGVPHADFMSRAVLGTPWQAYSWLFDLLVSRLFHGFGLTGIVLYTAGMLLAIAIATYRLASRRLDFSIAIALTFFVGFSMIPLETPRSWLFSILFFLLELDILMRVRDSGKMRDLVWIPVILGFWANLHIQFVHGLIMLMIAFGEAVVSRWWRDKDVRTSPQALGLTLVVSAAATLCSPYGWHIYRVAYDFGTQTEALNKISEVQAMAFRDPCNFTILVLAFAAVAALARHSRPLLFEKTLFVFAAFVSFHSQRDAWMMAAVACAILGARATSTTQSHPLRPGRYVLTFASLLSLVCCAFAVHAYKLTNEQLSEKQRSALPVDAAEFVTAHHLQGPLYNDFNWGGYLFWRLRLAVSMDGRVAPYGAERIDRSLATWNGEPNWAGDPLLQSANVIIGPVHMPLTQLLRLDPRFQLVYEDKLAAVFTRQVTALRAASSTKAGSL